MRHLRQELHAVDHVGQRLGLVRARHEVPVQRPRLGGRRSLLQGSGNSGTHTGSLWTASGTLLATGTFTNETASGWQSMKFANPVQISANTTYVVSYCDPDGHYAIDEEYFASQVNTPPLTAVKVRLPDTPAAAMASTTPAGQGFPTLNRMIAGATRST